MERTPGWKINLHDGRRSSEPRTFHFHFCRGKWGDVLFVRCRSFGLGYGVSRRTPKRSERGSVVLHLSRLYCRGVGITDVLGRLGRQVGGTLVWSFSGPNSKRTKNKTKQNNKSIVEVGYFNMTLDLLPPYKTLNYLKAVGQDDYEVRTETSPSDGSSF